MGSEMCIRDRGEPGTNGGPRGDLLVEVNVARHPIFQRQDMNIYSTAPLTYAQAALGGEIHINTVDGDVVYEVKPGTQTDTRIRLKGKGVPSLRNKNIRGDHYVTLIVQVPTKLNEEAKEALRRFDEACGNVTLDEKKGGSEKNEKKKKRENWSGPCRCHGIPSHLMALLRKNGELRKDMAEQNIKLSTEQSIEQETVGPGMGQAIAQRMTRAAGGIDRNRWKPRRLSRAATQSC